MVAIYEVISKAFRKTLNVVTFSLGLVCKNSCSLSKSRTTNVANLCVYLKAMFIKSPSVSKERLICFTKIIVLWSAVCFLAVYKTVSPGLSRTVTCVTGDAQKPLFVIGILTKDDTADRRKAMRTTWISTMNRVKDLLPFRITYKFLFDKLSAVSLHESKIYNDIVYLNVSHHGYAVKFGEKLYMWLQYIHRNYPDALLGSKIDDDTFLCVPHLIKRLYELRHPKLYYGWKYYHGDMGNIDEMFVVIGMDLINRIVKRHFCGQPKCNSTNDLIDEGHGGRSLFQWLSIYNDVEEHADNNRIVHKLGHNRSQFDHLINKDSCSNYVLFHKSLPETTYKLYNQTHLTQDVN